MLAIVTLPAYAQTEQVASVYHNVEKIDSAYVKEQRTAWVRVPLSYYQSRERYPVIYMLDGHTPFPSMMSGLVEQQAWGGKMPEAIVVSIRNTNRSRDMTPTDDGKGGRVGGAGNFLDFIQKELIPLVEKKYRTQPFRVFAGHSLAGLAVVYALVTRPDMFDGYIAASPVLRYDKRFVIREAGNSLPERYGKRKAVFVSIGDEPAYVDGFRSFERLLNKRKPKGLDFEFRRFKGENHGSVVLPAFFSGLRLIFKGWQAERISTLADLDRHYRRLSKKFGYEIRIPEAMLNSLGYRLLRAGRTREALEAFKRNAATYPESANVYDSLGDAYLRSGNRKKALENYRHAVKRASASGDDQAAETYRKKLERIEKN